MSDWGTGTKTADAADEWGSGGQVNDFGANDNFGGGNGFDDAAQFRGGAADGFDNGFGAATSGGAEAGSGGNRACFNCGQEGHNKAECPNERVFTGTCRVCEKEGHMAKDCPDKPPQICRNCGGEGHHASECKAARKLDRSNVEDVQAEVAWKKLTAAIKEQDMDDVKDAVQQYVKAIPEMTYVDLEEAFRSQGMGLHLIAIKKSVLSTYTKMDLQGNLDKTYAVTYRFDDKPARPREAEAWPKSPEENLERLKDAGEVVTRGLPKCGNCGEIGHISKRCPQEKQMAERVVIKCFNCGEEGHRMRDCTQPRNDRFACKNCGKPGHKVADCPEPRVAGDDVECRKCGEMGHFSRDCPQGGGGGSRACFNCGQEGHSSKDCTEPKNMAKVQCRNCDEFGHESRQCPKPRDYSRVTCSNCGETGHTKVRCKKEAVAPDTFDGGFDPPGETGPVDTSDWAGGNTGTGTFDTSDWAGGNTGSGAVDTSDWAGGNTGTGAVDW
ncbi:hypothetical protein DL765_003334 [Monosporascus sp. GIB2]|nr:hypothetical protein DL765_003334 [Monosporascus sp. GIB2]